MVAFKKIDKQKLMVSTVFVLYWFFAFFFFKLFYGGMEQTFRSSMAFTFCFLFISFVCVDIHSRFITKPYLQAKKYNRFILLSIYIFSAAFWLECVLTFILNIYFWDFDDGRILEETHLVRYQVGGVNMVVFGGIAIQFITETFRLQQQKEEKEKLSVESNLKLKEVELSLLKSQINPHFLFNSLNCIYGLSLEKSEQTPEVILQLSEILDYMLYKSQDEVLLSDELKQIENYTAIQKTRFGHILQLSYSKELISDIKIAPLLLLTLVENAFKHGKPNRENLLLVNIRIHCDEELSFSITNSFDNDPKMNGKGGIGLSNLKRRLYILYPKRYNLSIDKLEDQFTVLLNLKAEV